jgi:probable rRNA maturation factor
VSTIVEVVDHVGLGLPPGPVSDLVAAVLESEGISGAVVVAFVDERVIEGLNAEYRGQPEPTDVLSFRYGDEPSGWTGPVEAEAGEIVVCPAVVRRYAIEDGLSEIRQLGWTLIHGALHLVGYDHEKDQGEMRAREQTLLEHLEGLIVRLALPGR